MLEGMKNIAYEIRGSPFLNRTHVFPLSRPSVPETSARVAEQDRSLSVARIACVILR